MTPLASLLVIRPMTLCIKGLCIIDSRDGQWRWWRCATAGTFREIRVNSSYLQLHLCETCQPSRLQSGFVRWGSDSDSLTQSPLGWLWQSWLLVASIGLRKRWRFKRLIFWHSGCQWFNYHQYLQLAQAERNISYPLCEQHFRCSHGLSCGRLLWL